MLIVFIRITYSHTTNVLIPCVLYYRSKYSAMDDVYIQTAPFEYTSITRVASDSTALRSERDSYKAQLAAKQLECDELKSFRTDVTIERDAANAAVLAIRAELFKVNDQRDELAKRLVFRRQAHEAFKDNYQRAVGKHVRECDELKAESADLRSECDALRLLRNTLMHERDQYKTERDQLRAQLDQTTAERNAFALMQPDSSLKRRRMMLDHAIDSIRGIISDIPHSPVHVDHTPVATLAGPSRTPVSEMPVRELFPGTIVPLPVPVPVAQQLHYDFTFPDA
jgi:predicted  nucleic acid-binding Zn-ribbon protein